MRVKLFDSEEIKEIEGIAARYAAPASAIMPLLHFVQERKGHLEEKHLVFIADLLKVPLVRTFEVATYYTMFFTKPVGKHLIQVCRNLSCSVNGAPEVLASFKECLGVDVGETTPDGLFTIVEVECIGACDKAPAMMIDDKLYEMVSPETLDAILDSYRKTA